MSSPNGRHSAGPHLVCVLLPLAGILILGGFFIAGLPPGAHGPRAFLTAFADAFYLPDKNFIETTPFLGYSPYLSIYLLWAMLTAGLGVPALLLWRRLPAGVPNRLLFSSAGFWMLAAVTVMQTTGQGRYHLNEARIMGGKSTEDKIKLYFLKPLSFARYCHSILPGQHQGRAVTDLDMNDTQQMLNFIATAYYLYPLDIRLHRNPEPECLVIFAKKNPADAVAPGFTPAPPFDTKSLLAVRAP